MDFENLAVTLVKFQKSLKAAGASEEFAISMCSMFVTACVNALLATYKKQKQEEKREGLLFKKQRYARGFVQTHPLDD